MLLRRPSRLGRSRRPQVELKPRGWFGARNAFLGGRSKRSPRWRRLWWRFERSPSEISRLRPTKAVACRRCQQLSFGRGYLLLQIFRDPGVQRPPKQGKLRHWVVVTIVVSRRLLAWHARCIHASIKEAGVDGGVERWWHPKGNRTAVAEQPRACVRAPRPWNYFLPLVENHRILGRGEIPHTGRSLSAALWPESRHEWVSVF